MKRKPWRTTSAGFSEAIDEGASTDNPPPLQPPSGGTPTRRLAAIKGTSTGLLAIGLALALIVILLPREFSFAAALSTLVAAAAIIAGAGYVLAKARQNLLDDIHAPSIIAIVAGLWVLVTPFLFAGSDVGRALLLVLGLLTTVLAGYNASASMEEAEAERMRRTT